MKELKSIKISLTCFILTLALSPTFAKDNNRVMLFATSPVVSAIAGPTFKSHDNTVLADRPGYRAELLIQAGKQCHANIKFLIVPWKRALHFVEHGGADAIFSSSYTTERATYGAYPMKDGKPDTYRALRSYSYVLFTHKKNDLKWDGKKITGSGNKIAVERSSAAVGLVKSLGLQPIEMHKEKDMIQMLIAKRVDGLVAIQGNIKPVIAGTKKFVGHIEMQLPPLAFKNGYVMFSKRFYYQHTPLVECFWDAVGDIRSSEAHKVLMKSYTS